jgi:hypothetical protein
VYGRIPAVNSGADCVDLDAGRTEPDPTGEAGLDRTERDDVWGRESQLAYNFFLSVWQEEGRIDDPAEIPISEDNMNSPEQF